MKTYNKVDYLKAFAKLYHLLIHADGHVNSKETGYGRIMLQTDDINEKDFETELVLIAKQDHALILQQGIEYLKKLQYNHQLRCIAWLCIIANADSFMDNAEWSLIYSIYHKTLKFTTDEIMNAQRSIQREITSLKTLNSLGFSETKGTPVIKATV